VIPFRITANRLQASVHRAAEDSARVIFVPELGNDSLGERLTYLQALKCLTKGKIVGHPTRNEKGHWVFTMERYSANSNIVINVAAVCEGMSITQLIVFRQGN